MGSVLNERRLTEYEKESIELERSHPHKFDPELEFAIQKRNMGEFKQPKYRTLSLQETQLLLNASNRPVKEKKKEDHKTNYTTYSREEVERMVKEHFEYKIQQEEKEKQWASTKTTEFGEKTPRTTKRSRSMKRSRR